eukprot:maker-scaffold324_size206069-snap-gene-1.33 protein:Tk12294 transcript:maker-scaffold324_size206069-snap-gene-1.33-mRNA-1 annotation:"PREDICTED: uncharacterized protein LOC101932660"
MTTGCSPVDGVWRCSITNSAEQKTEQLVACDQSCIDELARPCHTTLNVLADGTETSSSTCVFPFTYHGRTYHSCTNAGHDEYWCVTNDAPNDWAWGPCEVSCPKFGWRDPETQCRSIDHKVCQFPFIYEDQLYESCTFEDHEKPWCPYVLNNLGSVTEYWGICEQSCPGSQCLSEGLGPCVFPFGYQGQTHYTCTTVDHNVPWCSIENDPDGNILVFAQCEDTLACSMSFNLPDGMSSDPRGIPFTSCANHWLVMVLTGLLIIAILTVSALLWKYHSSRGPIPTSPGFAYMSRTGDEEKPNILEDNDESYEAAYL